MWRVRHCVQGYGHPGRSHDGGGGHPAVLCREADGSKGAVQDGRAERFRGGESERFDTLTHTVEFVLRNTSGKKGSHVVIHVTPGMVRVCNTWYVVVSSCVGGVALSLSVLCCFYVGVSGVVILPVSVSSLTVKTEVQPAPE